MRGLILLLISLFAFGAAASVDFQRLIDENSQVQRNLSREVTKATLQNTELASVYDGPAEPQLQSAKIEIKLYKNHDPEE